jgi:hypothetical protein
MPESQTELGYFGSAKCIDIDDINSLACFRKDAMNVFFTKLDDDRYQTTELGSINNTKVLKNGTDNNSYVNNIENQVVEELLYDSRSGQICQLFDLSLQCFQLRTKCVSGGEL